MVPPTDRSSERGVILSDVTKTFGDEFDSKLVVAGCSFRIEGRTLHGTDRAFGVREDHVDRSHRRL